MSKISESEMAKWMFENTIDYWCDRLEDWKIQQMEELFKQCPNLDLDWRTYLISGLALDNSEEHAKFINDMPDNDLKILVKLYDSDRKK
jgi:hypothetical protein